MTEKRANEILRTKYPKARIYNGKRFGGATSSEMVVVFDEGGKCYNYSASSYQQVLEKLGFKILYKHNVESMNRRIAELEKQIADRGEENRFHLFDKRDFIPYADDEVKARERELESIRKEIKESYIE